MLKIDSHQHFWKYNPIRDNWIDESMVIIQNDFLPHHFEPVLKENGFEGCIVIQSDQTEEENTFQLENAKNNDFIKGVVGWVDLPSENIEDQLTYYSRFDKLKGFRHILQGETDRALMLKSEFKRGISKLNKFGFTYDVLIFPDQLQYATQLVSEFPDQPFVIDHLAKPYIKDKKIDDWKKDMDAISKFENVYCKVSGMVTEANWRNWNIQDFTPYMDVVLNAFGANRLMFGSDWPVCLIAAEYKQVVEIVENYTAKLSVNEQEAFWCGNAKIFYGLE